jgi:hypothetical protein
MPASQLRISDYQDVAIVAVFAPSDPSAVIRSAD